MSFIIKGKEPPKCCAECMFFKKKISFPDYSVSCLLGGTPPEPWPMRYAQRGAGCPVVDFPDPSTVFLHHGELTIITDGKIAITQADPKEGKA